MTKEIVKVNSPPVKNPKLAWMTGPIKSDKWKNLIFTKNGKMYLGILVWSSEKEAFEAMQEVLRFASSVQLCGIPVLDGPVKCLRTSSGEYLPCILSSEYSYSIQMPWKE